MNDNDDHDYGYDRYNREARNISYVVFAIFGGIPALVMLSSLFR